ncbi:MAG: CesT family type III secretion system chaperone [Kiritimatiellae bacterium]|nr:CesT family type III secretion system chaperone [Kiritimatiellia bacterium]
MAGTCEDALGALSERLGMPLEFHDGSCSFNIGGQPFTITRDDEQDRLVVSALVADDLPDAPSRQLTADILNLGFGMMLEGLPAVGRDPETGFLAAFTLYPCSRLVAAEFPDSFTQFVSFAARLAERLEAERGAAASGQAREEVVSHHDMLSSGYFNV